MGQDEKVDYRQSLGEIERILRIQVTKEEQTQQLLFKMWEELKESNKIQKEALSEFKKLEGEVKTWPHLLEQILDKSIAKL